MKVFHTVKDVAKNLAHVFECLNHSDTLWTEWESNFISSVESQFENGKSLSAKQLEIIIKLLKRS